MTRRRKIGITVIVGAAVLILAVQLWGPAPKECDGPCSGWEWGLVAGVAIFGVVVLLVGLVCGYAIRSIVRARRGR